MGSVQIENLPGELREKGLFCCWRREQREGKDKPTKVPYNPKTGGRAQSTNPATFAPLAIAEAAPGQYDGLGVGVFNGLGAIDIDHCISETGEISNMAADIMSVMQAYTEYSPSGTGLRILFKTIGYQYDKARYYINNQKAGLEVYIAGCTNKFVTVTGNALTPGMDLEERGKQLQAVLEKYMVRPSKMPTPRPEPPTPVALDDMALLQRAKQGKGGAAFASLWAGDTSGYPSQSEADIALCNALVWWTNGDAERVDRLFRQSGLMREKWDRPQAGSTYGAITLQNAIAGCVGGYDPRAHFRRKSDKLTTGTAAGPATLAGLHPEKNEHYGWNDIGSGNLFADWYRDRARYVPERRKWFVYDGRVWVPDTGNLRVMELCKALADALTVYALSIKDEQQRSGYLDFVTRWQRRNHRETILKDAASVYPVELSRFDADPFLFNCLNGTLDLRTRVFHPHRAEDMLATVSGVLYDPNVRCERWEQVVDEVMQGDLDKAVFLQKAMGYGLTGDTSEECLFLLYGATTRNGKGTISETYMRLQGGYGRAATPDTIAQKQNTNSSGPSEDIARLAGARAVNISEPGKQMALSASLVKTLTGNDTITARFLNENSFEYRPQFKLFINTNHLPKVTDVTVFSSGRVKVIPFERHFTETEQDKGLKRMLARPESLSGVLNWCLDGLWMLRETGFDPPAAVRKATEQYRKDSDKISRFVEDMLTPDLSGEIRTEDAYRAYQDWCVRNGQFAEALPTFRQSMEGFAEIRKKRPAGAGRETSKRSLILGLKWKCGPVRSTIL